MAKGSYPFYRYNQGEASSISPFYRDFTGKPKRHWVGDAVALGLCSSKLSHVTSKGRGTFLMRGLLQTGMTLTS